MKKKKILISFITVMLLFMLTGCTRQEYQVTINDSNNVQFDVKVLISKESYNLISTFGIDTDELEDNKISDTGTEIDNIDAVFQETALLFQDYGFTVKSLDDAVDIGFSASKTYLTVEEFNQEIKTLCDNNLSGLNLDIQYVNKTNKKEYTAYGTLDYVLDPDMGLDDETIKSYFDKQYDSTNMTATAYIIMPASTTVSAYDGTPAQSCSIQWTTSYTEGQKDVHVISNYSDNTMYYAFALICIIILLVIAFFVLRAHKFKKEKQNSALSEEYEYEQSEEE